MARKLQDMSHDFRGMQKSYLDQLRKFKGGGSAASFSALIGEPTPTPGDVETKEADKVCQHCRVVCRVCRVCRMCRAARWRAAQCLWRAA